MGAGKKSKYTPELAKKITDMIEDGNFSRTAAHANNISEDTFYTWIKKHSEFAEAVKKARAKAESKHVRNINKHSFEHWQASAWYLERTNFAKWGRKTHVINEEVDSFKDWVKKMSEDQESEDEK